MRQYEKKGYVSLWFGTLASRAAFEKYVAEDFSNEMLECQFASDFSITYDSDWREVNFSKKPITLGEMLSTGKKGFSYQKSYSAEAIKSANALGNVNGNTAILILDFAYSPPKRDRITCHQLLFIGSFTYERDDKDYIAKLMEKARNEHPEDFED